MENYTYHQYLSNFEIGQVGGRVGRKVKKEWKETGNYIMGLPLVIFMIVTGGQDPFDIFVWID